MTFWPCDRALTGALALAGVLALCACDRPASAAAQSGPPAPCGEAAVQTALRDIRSGRLQAKRPAYDLARTAATCGWRGSATGRTLAQALAHAPAGDPDAIAVAALAVGGLTPETYLRDTRRELAATYAGGAVAAPLAAVAVDRGAGACPSPEGAACVRGFLDRALPDAARLEPAADLAFGDLFPPRARTSANPSPADRALVVDSGLPLNADALRALPAAEAAGARRRGETFFLKRYGRSGF